MIWFLMREAAVWRHRWVHSVFEGGDPKKWPRHAALIRAFYGW